MLHTHKMLSSPKSLIGEWRSWLMNEEDKNASGDFHYVKGMGPVGHVVRTGISMFLPLRSMGPVGPTWLGQG